MYRRVNKGSDLQLYFPTKGVTADNIRSGEFNFFTDSEYKITIEYGNPYCYIDENSQFSIFISSDELDEVNEGVLRYEYSVSYDAGKPEVVNYTEKSNTDYYIKRDSKPAPVPGGDYYTKEETDAKFEDVDERLVDVENKVNDIEGEDVSVSVSTDIFDFENVQQGFEDVCFVIADTKENMAKKLEPTDLKTINGESIVGTGDIEIHTDLSDYYTKDETNTKIDEQISDQQFKTINGESIKGEGDIEIKGGGDSDILLKKEDIDLDAIPVGSVFTDGVNVFQKVEREMNPFTGNVISQGSPFKYRFQYIAIPEDFYGQKLCRFHYYDTWGYDVYIVDKNTLRVDRVMGSYTDGGTITKGETYTGSVQYNRLLTITFGDDFVELYVNLVACSVDQIISSTALIAFAEQVDGRDRLIPLTVTANNQMRFPQWNTNGIVTGFASEETFTTNWCNVNGTQTKLCGPSNSNYFKVFTVFGPTTAGTKGQIIRSNGSGAPVWDDAPLFRTLTKEEYDALETKDNNTVYFIKG